ncbi:enkurin-like [Eucyclogobius newberryi]|uniref:enkurin-like n=1 Tax=Eucyclogobius newberryi TaxID=166745 RepID=UPI003B5A94DA
MPTQVYPPQESIYDLLPKKQAIFLRPPQYVSKYRPTVVKEVKLLKRPMRTMGPAQVEVPSPEKFLKKHSKEPKPSDKSQSTKGRIRPLTKPPVPTRTEIAQMDLLAKEQFTKTCSFVSKPKPISVDNNKGIREALENAGQIPKYIQKKDFGDVPLYLKRHNAEKLKEQEMYDNYVKEQRKKQAMKQLPEEERVDILKGLKKNWDLANHEYQNLPMFIDTRSKLAYKERLETQLKKLEKDIETFERFKIIYISDN